jgi:uncharacterized protein YggE
MRVYRVVSTIGVCLLLPGALRAQSQQPTAASEISASGIAEIKLAPDHALLFTTVETRDRTATSATRANGIAVDNIMQALRKAGLPAAAVTTSDFSVDQYFPNRYDSRASQEPDGFVTRTVIRAETDDITQVSALIDAALASGATRIGVQFSSLKLSEARRGALATAFTAAHDDALALANAAGGNLGRLLSLAPNGPSMVLYRLPSQTAEVTTLSSVVSGTATSARLSPGNVTSSILVSTRWEFIPGAGH